jgi:hypothetical protein
VNAEGDPAGPAASFPFPPGEVGCGLGVARLVSALRSAHATRSARRAWIVTISELRAWRATLSPGSAYWYVKALRQLLHYAIAVGLVDENLTTKIPNPAPKKREVPVFGSMAEVEAVGAEMDPAYAAIPARRSRPGQDRARRVRRALGRLRSRSSSRRRVPTMRSALALVVRARGTESGPKRRDTGRRSEARSAARTRRKRAPERRCATCGHSAPSRRTFLIG